jgi:hypothetical protein
MPSSLFRQCDKRDVRIRREASAQAQKYHP